MLYAGVVQRLVYQTSNLRMRVRFPSLAPRRKYVKRLRHMQIIQLTKRQVGWSLTCPCTDVAELANAAGGELAKDGFDSHRSKRGGTFVGSNPTIWSIGNNLFPNSLPFPFHYESQNSKCS